MIRTALLVTAASLLALTAHAAAGAAAGAAEGTAEGTAAGRLALKRVLLSTGGVGYFELEARVSGDSDLALEVRRDQVDDVLKSIVVYDETGGVGTIGLPGPEPLETAFRELPVSPDDLGSPTALLNALRGAEVTVGGARALSGRLLSVTEETVQLPDGGGTVPRHRVSLMTGDGLRQLVLEDADGLRFTDPALQAQLDRALAAMAEGTRKERRRLTVRVTGSGERTVRVGYVVAAPLWKATYRLTLPKAGTGQGALQGWAVLENLSGEDWRDVDLTVVSGNPVTLRQALYTAYFVNRPEVPVEVLGRVLPRPDEGGVEVGTADQSRARMAEAAPPAPGMPAPTMAPAPKAMGAPAQGYAAPPPAVPLAAESTAATAQVLFRYPQPVSVANGGTLMMPIAAKALPAERIALYQPSVQPRHPLAAVRLDNDTGGALPPGVLTLFDQTAAGAAFVGDARMATLPAGEKRMLSFAVDQDLTIDRAERPDETLSRATLADGVLQLTVTERQTTTYTLAGAREDRSVVIEHPRRGGWDLVEPRPAAGGTVEATPGAWRLPVAVPAGKTVALAVVTERPRQERMVLTDLDPDRIVALAAAPQLPAPVREALGRVGALRATLAEKERRVAGLEREQAEQVKEQERLRENLGALPNGSDLQKRTLAKMGEIETRLDGLSRSLTAARGEVEAARRTLTDQVRGLRL
ncbi:DUF4139 domain-containing protein [Azospirillum thermophilum]|uniref:DUF4139 domain-containing protein n=1 Tax=Azospirillum thermophilum TaxID=2202148 RepID=A0A2S2CPN8_9PROT|nr:DUF4139 domain-containing protein [Azospirillum thermophilum]AWK86419.1 hypothetical protein DEW08_09350 [Azospirillum thermophilum]